MRKGCALVVALLVAAGTAASFSSDVAAQGGGEKTWIVMYRQQGRLPQDTDGTVENAGGTITVRLPEIGVLGAASRNPAFADEMSADSRVLAVIEDQPVQVIPSPAGYVAFDQAVAAAAAAGPVESPGGDAQTGADPFYTPFQWDKKRMRASDQGSYAVQQGRPEVVVAVLDTGAQVLPTPHPDIVPNLDFTRSRAFYPNATAEGDADPAAWDDRNGHGSWCLSAIGAPINGIGMSGVAPRVRLVALKVIGDDGSSSFLSIARALIYSGYQKFDIASMSFGAYLRKSDQSTKFLLYLITTSVQFARLNGVTPIAALGNDSLDLSDGSVVRNYVLVPAEVQGVIGVSATGYFNLKASYSNYGTGKADVAAPGGDYAVQTPSTSYPGFGSVLGAWASDNTSLPGAEYVFASGTSMATPNAAGVAALIVAQYGDFTPDHSIKAHMSPQAVEAILQQTSNNQSCPDPSRVTYYLVSPPFPPNIPVPNVQQGQRCTGGAGHTNFYGKGIVDAVKAVTGK
jgi:lantibiotic leader peptide-processing serine protease